MSDLYHQTFTPFWRMQRKKFPLYKQAIINHWLDQMMKYPRPMPDEDDYDDFESEDETINEIVANDFGGSEEPDIVENISAQPLGDEVLKNISFDLDVKYDEYGSYVEADCKDEFVTQTQMNENDENKSVVLVGNDEYGFYVESDAEKGHVEETPAYENDEYIGGDQIVEYDEYGFFVESECIGDFVAQNLSIENCENERVTNDFGGSGEPGNVEIASDAKHGVKNFQNKKKETNLNGKGVDCIIHDKRKKKGFWSSFKNLFCSCWGRK